MIFIYKNFIIKIHQGRSIINLSHSKYSKLIVPGVLSF